MSYHINCKSCGGANEIHTGKISMFCNFCGSAIQIEKSISEENLESEEIRRDRELQVQIKSLIKSGSKLHAVKLYMDAAGVGLKEAKEYIDNKVNELI